MINRRAFLKTVAAAGATVAFTPKTAFSAISHTMSPGFGVHPFVEAHPEAVFILRTAVDVKTNASAIKSAGLSFGRSVFLPLDVASDGIPLTHMIPIKPNLTCRARTHSMYTVERSMGIQTDANFVEGIIESMKELGIPGSQFAIREVNCPEDFADGGYYSMAARTGADIRDLSAEVRKKKLAIMIIAVPSAAAQVICNQVVAAGVKSILNFAPVNLKVPPDVLVRTENMAMELEFLSFHQAHRQVRAAAPA